MRTFTPLILLLCFLAQNLHSQALVKSREATLQEGMYTISGKAFLEEYDDGALKLRLDDDFETPRGPDVQIYLSNHPTSISNGLKVEDIGTGAGGINHFRGTITFDLTSQATIDQYEYVVFRCVAFNLHWAGGRFGESSEENNGGGNTFECVNSVTATTDWVADVKICPNDGQPDVIPILNNFHTPAGDHYAFVIADEQNKVLSLHYEDTYDFEGSGLDTTRVFGLSYDGTPNFVQGGPLSSISATGCFILSDTTIHLRVAKENCNPDYECLESLTATTNWESRTEICVGDGQADVVQFQNNNLTPAGDHYVYVIADQDKNIIKLHFEDMYDFENSAEGVNRVYGVSYDGTLDYQVGQSITSITASGCAILSDTSTFLLVVKNICTASIQGRITDSKGDGVPNVAVSINSTYNTTTSSDGSYLFTDMPTNTSYTIVPSKNDGLLERVSTLDVFLMQKHILGIEEFTNVFQFIAANTNGNGSVSTSDLLPLQQLILGINDNYPRNQSWRFVDASVENIDPYAFQESIVVSDLQEDIPDADFKAVKVGDLNQPLSSSEANSKKELRQTMLQIKVKDQFIKKGAIAKVPLITEGFTDIAAFQMTMQLADLEVMEITSVDLNPTDILIGQHGNGLLTTLWSTGNPMTTGNIFTITVKAKEDVQLSQAFLINSDITEAVAFDHRHVPLNIGLEFYNDDLNIISNVDFQLQNVPNPFSNQTVIQFELASEGHAAIEIFDSSGRSLFKKNGLYQKGNNELVIDEDIHLPTGLLYYQLTSDNHKETRKMIRIMPY